MIRKIICIMIIFVLLSVSSAYGFKDLSKVNSESESNIEPKIKAFFIGFINNLSYVENIYDNGYYNYYKFNCSRVFSIIWLPFQILYIHHLINGESVMVIDAKRDEMEYEIYGFIGDKFICAINTYNLL